MNEKVQIHNTMLFAIGFMFCVVGIALLSLAPFNTPCNEGCQELACKMDESQCPQPEEQMGVSITDVVVKDRAGNIRSVSFLDCNTGEYRTYTSDNMSTGFPGMQEPFKPAWKIPSEEFTSMNHTIIPKEGEAIGGGS